MQLDKSLEELEARLREKYDTETAERIMKECLEQADHMKDAEVGALVIALLVYKGAYGQEFKAKTFMSRPKERMVFIAGALCGALGTQLWSDYKASSYGDKYAGDPKSAKTALEPLRVLDVESAGDYEKVAQLLSQVLRSLSLFDGEPFAHTSTQFPAHDSRN